MEHGEITEEERGVLLDLARSAIELHVTGKPQSSIDRSCLTERLIRPSGCFVTLYEHGSLRGCIGRVSEDLPLYRGVVEAAISSATRDYRFHPVKESELPHLELHISVLTSPRTLVFNSIQELEEQVLPERDGVIIRNGWMSALYLPQVWEHFKSSRHPFNDFMTSLSRKAGDFSGRLWSLPETEIQVFESIDFSE